MMNNLPMMKRLGEFLAALAVSGLLLGCSSSHFSNNNTTPASLPTAGQPTTSNTYTGTQSPGYWSLTLDDTQKVFSYQPVTNATSSTTPLQGGFSVANGIDDFGTTSTGASAGLAVEIPSRLTTLRPGDNTTTPVSMVQQSSCFALTGSIRYIYAGVLAGATISGDANGANGAPGGSFPAYGSFVVSTSSDGKSWQFGDVKGYQLTSDKTGGGVGPGSIAGGSPFSSLMFSGACQASNGEGIVTPSADAATAMGALPTFAFHPAGYFVMDQPAPLQKASISWLGFAMPRSPLSAALITAGSYSGFVFEPLPSTHTNPTVVTQPVSLSQAFGVSGALAGGPYPNDDPSQTPLAMYTLTLGKQDSTLNGVFPTATLVMPDPAYECAAVAANTNPAKPGFDLNGNPTCITEGVAVVAAPDGKYVIYFTAEDGTAGSPGPAAFAYPLQMYLYQQ